MLVDDNNKSNVDFIDSPSESNTVHSNHIYDVVIIGSGLSGLYAATLLKDHGVNNYCLLEARDRIGGRLLTKRDPKVGYVDLGGSYVGPSQIYVHKLIKKYRIQTYKINGNNGKSVYLNKKGRYLHDSDKLPSLSNKLVQLEIKNVLDKFERMSRQLSRDEPWTHPKAREWDLQTFGDFLEQHCWSQEAKDFISIYIGCCTSCEAYEQSLLWALWYTKQCDGLDIMYGIENAAQDSKLIGGTQQLCERMFDEIDGQNKIKLNRPVSQLINRHGSDTVTIKTLDGSEYHCRYVILTVPPVLVHKIHFDPPLPPVYQQMLQKFTMGSAIKCIVYYEDSFWRNISDNNQGPLNGNMVINCPGLDGPITYTLDDTKPDGSYPAIVGFIIGDRARLLLQTTTKEQRLRTICESYRRAFHTDKALRPIHYEEKNWMQEQYTGGCFTAIGQPGWLTNYGHLLSQPLFNDRVFLAGTETSTHWAGYMDGALQAAERAAFQILERILEKPNLIRVCEEQTISIDASNAPDHHCQKRKQFKNSLLFDLIDHSLMCWSVFIILLIIILSLFAYWIFQFQI